MKITKTQTALAVATILTAGVAQAATTHTMTDGRFDFKAADGTVTTDGHLDVQGAFDMVNGTGSFTTSTNFVGFTWSADVIEMRFNSSFQDGVGTADEAHTFSWDVQSWFIGGAAVTCVDVVGLSDNCVDEAASGGLFLGTTTNSTSYTLDPGQFAAHTLFDWSVNDDIPVISIQQVVATAGNPMNPTMTTASVGSNGLVSDYAAAGAPGVPSAAADANLHGVPMPTCAGCGPFPGQTPILGGTIEPIPVPAAVWLFGSGLLGLVGVARRRKA